MADATASPTITHTHFVPAAYQDADPHTVSFDTSAHCLKAVRVTSGDMWERSAVMASARATRSGYVY